MNTTQYYLHNNFLVVQNGEYNDTFDLRSGYMNAFWKDFTYYDNAEYTDKEIESFATLFFENLSEPLKLDSHCVNSFGYIKCIIPNGKVTINYTDWNDKTGRLSFFLNNRFVFAIFSESYDFLSNIEGELTTNQYCEILFETASKETRNQLNEIIKSLNTLAKYDAH